MCPGPQIPQEHWGLTVGSAGLGTLHDAVLCITEPLLRVITLPDPSVGFFHPGCVKPYPSLPRGVSGKPGLGNAVKTLC